MLLCSRQHWSTILHEMQEAPLELKWNEHMMAPQKWRGRKLFQVHHSVIIAWTEAALVRHGMVLDSRWSSWHQTGTTVLCDRNCLNRIFLKHKLSVWLIRVDNFCENGKISDCLVLWGLIQALHPNLWAIVKGSLVFCCWWNPFCLWKHLLLRASEHVVSWHAEHDSLNVGMSYFALVCACLCCCLRQGLGTLVLGSGHIPPFFCSHLFGNLKFISSPTISMSNLCDILWNGRHDYDRVWSLAHLRHTP